MLRDDVENCLAKGVAIIETEIKEIQCMIKENPLDKLNSSKLCEYLKALVAIRKDWRMDKEDEIAKITKLKDADLDAAIKAELAKLK